MKIMKLLIVDDSEIIRDAIEEWLSKFNLEIVGRAGTGLEAIELFKTRQPDVVTLDITMPDLDGLEALDQMMKINNNVTIIIISALSAKEIALSALKKGAALFVNKPFTREELHEAFEEAIGD